jgi:hypothetical protein
MTELLNSPQILSLFFPLLSILITLPLLRWAVQGEKAPAIASTSVAIACLIASVIAFGRPDGPFQFGMGALFYGLCAATILLLLSVTLLEHKILRAVGCLLTVLIWCWILVGMPLDAAMAYKALYAGSVLFGLCLLFVFRSRWEVAHDGNFSGNLISCLVIAATLWVIASWSDDFYLRNMTVALIGISATALIWTIRRIRFPFQENAVVILALTIASVIWDMWLNGHVPVASLFCLVLVLFTRSAAVKLLANAPLWLQKCYYPVLGLLCLLPAGLSLIFYDILRNL